MLNQVLTNQEKILSYQEKFNERIKYIETNVLQVFEMYSQNSPEKIKEEQGTSSTNIRDIKNAQKETESSISSIPERKRLKLDDNSLENDSRLFGKINFCKVIGRRKGYNLADLVAQPTQPSNRVYLNKRLFLFIKDS